MNLSDAKVLAEQHMEAHGLLAAGWVLKFYNRTTAFGTCNYKEKTIYLSKPLAACNREETINDTILHEIAHALTEGSGHGPEWVAKALSIGCNGKICKGSEDNINIPYRYVAQCPDCGHVFKRVSKPRTNWSCLCTRGRASLQYNKIVTTI